MDAEMSLRLLIAAIAAAAFLGCSIAIKIIDHRPVSRQQLSPEAKARIIKAMQEERDRIKSDRPPGKPSSGTGSQVFAADIIANTERRANEPGN